MINLEGEVQVVQGNGTKLKKPKQLRIGLRSRGI